MASLQARAIGWTGKLPWLGDFVGRGLPRPWLRRWDDWLQRGLAEAEARLGPAEVRERVRGMAPWLCLLPPARAGEPAWCGIVAASADRVGRAYPLLFAEGHDAAALDGAGLAALQARALALSDWLYDALALESLADFERAAAAWGETPWADGDALAAGQGSVGSLRRTRPAAATLWWCTEPVGEMNTPLAEAWPPRPALVLDLLGAG